MWPEDEEKWAGFSEIEDRALCLGFWEPFQAESRFLEMAKRLQLFGGSHGEA